MDREGNYTFSTSDDDILLTQAPEILFLERCLDWIKPGGRLGIVMPKGFLDNCTIEWTTVGGVSGCKFTGKAEPYSSNSVFLPAAGICYYEGSVGYQNNGYYWSSTPDGNIVLASIDNEMTVKVFFEDENGNKWLIQ